MKTTTTPKRPPQEVMKKEILNAADVAEFFNNEIKREKALQIIKEVNAFNNRFNIRGKCAAADFIGYFNLNPAEYGRAAVIVPASGQTSDQSGAAL